MELVLVDVDGTLIDGQSYTSVLQEIWQQRWRRPRLAGLLARRLPFQALRKLRLVDRLQNQERWARGMAWLLAAAPVAEVQGLMHAACGRLVPRMRQQVVAELAEHRRVGRRVCLASTAVEPVLEALAPFVPADAWVGTRLAVRDGRYTGELEGPPCNGAVKLRYVEESIGSGIDWAESYAYSDGLPDLPMLERVGHAVLVDPDSALALVAGPRGWRVL